MNGNLDSAVFGGGCFWCTEAVFKRLKGVERVESGYAGGKTENPTYEQVSSEETGHAEVIKISFDPEQISYQDLLEVFWRTHNPTTLNQQGNDHGTQYRSIILYSSEAEKQQAEASKKAAEIAGIWPGKFTTEIVPLTKYYPAEGYHQNYYNDNNKQPYCVFVIDPKIQKLQKDFKDKLKTAS